MKTPVKPQVPERVYLPSTPHPPSALMIVRYERCLLCADGTCGKCGRASHSTALLGVVAVQRKVEFESCSSCAGGDDRCPQCGPSRHALATHGIRPVAVLRRVFSAVESEKIR